MEWLGWGVIACGGFVALPLWRCSRHHPERLRQMEVIEASTGVSIQVVVLVLGGAIAFGVGALKWIDTRINGAAEKLGAQILALDERYRTDRLGLEGRIVRLESRPDQSQHWPRNHSMNGQ